MTFNNQDQDQRVYLLQTPEKPNKIDPVTYLVKPNETYKVTSVEVDRFETDPDKIREGETILWAGSNEDQRVHFEPEGYTLPNQITGWGPNL